MILKGLDNGYAYTKDSNRKMFKSAYSLTDKMVTGSKHITIDNTDYWVGVGDMTSEVDKVNADINKACTITNLTLSGPGEYMLVVGLPIGSFKTQAKKFKQTVLSYSDCEVVKDGKLFEFSIKDVLVFPQGAAALYSTSEIQGDCILVDIGGLTIDVALIERNFNMPSIVNSDTWYKGIRILYSNVTEQVNNRFNLRLETRYAEKIIMDGLYIRGEKQDTSFLQPTYQEYIRGILEEIDLRYPTKTVPILLCGGGAQIMYSAFKEKFRTVTIMRDAQFANAVGYYNIGINAFSKYAKV